MPTYSPNSRGRCPYCFTVVRFESAQPLLRRLGDNSVHDQFTIHAGETLRFTVVSCPECRKAVITVETGKVTGAPSQNFVPKQELVVWPLQGRRPPVPPEVPAHIAADYSEAALVESLSPKASAALSRRCLQSLLRDQGYNQYNLSQQIDKVIPSLPSYIQPNIDAVRNIGNFAAHPMKSEASGEIVDVEPGEADWNLTVLEQLFDHFYVQPEQAKKRREELNAKLTDIGQKPMK